MAKKKPMTASEMGRRGGKRAWKKLSAVQRTKIMRARALKAWRTKRRNAREKVSESP